jgi:hypothetical protein
MVKKKTIKKKRSRFELFGDTPFWFYEFGQYLILLKLYMGLFCYIITSEV